MIPKTGRHNQDGSISFPQRGIPPACNEPGYIEDPGDPFRWLMVYTPCIFRELQKEVKCPRSGKMRHLDFCNKLGIQTNPRYCNVDCSVPKVEKQPCQSKCSNEERNSVSSMQPQEQQTVKGDVTQLETKPNVKPLPLI